MSSRLRSIVVSRKGQESRHPDPWSNLGGFLCAADEELPYGRVTSLGNFRSQRTYEGVAYFPAANHGLIIHIKRLFRPRNLREMRHRL